MKKISIEGKTRRLPDNFVSLLGFPEPENFHFLGLRPKSESENFQNLKMIGKISKTLKVIESKKISTKLSESFVFQKIYKNIKIKELDNSNSISIFFLFFFNNPYEE